MTGSRVPLTAPTRPRFLYSDEVQIGPETVMTTLYTAKKYAVPALEAHCVEFLKKNLRADNAFMLLTQVAGCWGQVELLGACPESEPSLFPGAGSWGRNQALSPL